MAKMIAVASGYNDDINGVPQRFSDVPSYDIFYSYVQRLAMHQAIPIYPTAVEQPCSTQTATCYFPYTSTVRSDVATHIERAYAFKFGPAQVFSMRGKGSGHNGEPYYDGVQITITPPNAQGLHPGFNETRSAAGPVAVGSQYNDIFAESGPKTYCTGVFGGTQCTVYPYASVENGRLGISDGVQLNVTLPTDTPTIFSTIYDYNSHTWIDYYCPFNCQPLFNQGHDMGVSSMAYVIGGGEGVSGLQFSPIGTLTLTNGYARVNGSYNASACPDFYLPQRIAGDGSITPCNIHTWTVTYNHN